jgi:hypothetical protein
VPLNTNLPFENWTEVLGNERLTGAPLDRLTHRVHIIEAKGESYRLKAAKKRGKNSPDKNLPSPPEGREEKQRPHQT